MAHPIEFKPKPVNPKLELQKRLGRGASGAWRGDAGGVGPAAEGT